MGMTRAQIGNGSGFIYITKPDGTTIVSNIENQIDVYQKVQQFMLGTASLSDPTLIINATFGYKVFGNTAGTEGDLTGSTELTRFLVPRSGNIPNFKVAATIATGIVTVDRIASSMLVVVDTEGGAGTDDLDTITITDVVDNDTIIIVGANVAHIVTLRNGIGNIHLANSANFSTGTQTGQIILKYLSGAWYESVRANTLPTVANLRSNGVACPVQGVNLTTLTAGGGTIDIEAGVDKGYQLYAGTANLAGSWVIQPKAAPTIPYLDGDEIWVDYRALLTTGANTVTIFGILLTTIQALQGRVMIMAKYKLSNTTWYAKIFYDATGVDITNKAYVDSTFEPYLGVPASDGMILSSLIDGTRSWVAFINPDSGWNDLDGFSFLPNGSRPQYRTIGKELIFRGTAIVPLSSDGGTTIVPYTSEASYIAAAYIAPYTGTGATGGVLVNAAGSIVFNQNSAVIPADIFPDTSMSMEKIIYRRVNSNSAGTVIVYTGYVNVFIGVDGKLTVQTVFDIEEYTPGQVLGSSMYRLITSKATTGDYALDYRIITGGTLQGITANAALTPAIGNQTFKHIITLDAAIPSHIGGFNVSLDGLKAYTA